MKVQYNGRNLNVNKMLAMGYEQGEIANPQPERREVIEVANIVRVYYKGDKIILLVRISAWGSGEYIYSGEMGYDKSMIVVEHLTDGTGKEMIRLHYRVSETGIRTSAEGIYLYKDTVEEHTSILESHDYSLSLEDTFIRNRKKSRNVSLTGSDLEIYLKNKKTQEVMEHHLNPTLHIRDSKNSFLDFMPNIYKVFYKDFGRDFMGKGLYNFALVFYNKLLLVGKMLIDFGGSNHYKIMINRFWEYDDLLLFKIDNLYENSVEVEDEYLLYDKETGVLEKDIDCEIDKRALSPSGNPMVITSYCIVDCEIVEKKKYRIDEFNLEGHGVMHPEELVQNYIENKYNSDVKKIDTCAEIIAVKRDKIIYRLARNRKDGNR